MTAKKNYITELQKKLFSGNETVILNALSEIAQSGNANTLPLLFDLYLSSESNTIQKKIFQIACDINDKAIISFLVDSLHEAKYQSIKKDILSICWQSRHDFSEYAIRFFDIFESEELVIAIEAFTVLEESYPNMKPEEQSKLRSMIENKKDKLEQTKAELLAPLLS